jgi:hypothetical protein
VWIWNGTSWVLLSGTGTGSSGSYDGVFLDSVRNRVVAFDGAGTLDIFTGNWTTLTAPVFGAFAVGAADPVSGDLIVVRGTTEWRFDGVDWHEGLAADYVRPQLVVDSARNRLLLIDRTTIYERSGLGWAYVADLPEPRTAGVVFDGTRGELVLFGELDGGVWRWNGASWQKTLAVAPRAFAPLTFDPGRNAVVAASAGELWRLDGSGWQRTSAALPSGTYFAIVHEPVRGGLVLATEAGMLLENAGWTPFAPGFPTNAVAYDPVGHRLVAAVRYAGARTSDAVALGSTDTSWSFAGRYTHNNSADFFSDLWSSVAWDARNATLLAFERREGVFEIGASLSKLLTAGTGSYGVADARRGSVVLLPISFSVASMIIWERLGGTWTNAGSLPQSFYGTAAYSPDDGTIVMHGHDFAMVMTLVRERVSSTPLESCRAGEDVDGDALAGCDDPDCFWMCTPSCPPYTVCP